MNPQELIHLFGPNRVGVLSTADDRNRPNAAVVGSARLPDSQALIIGLGANRSLQNLQENPRAVFTFFDPGPTPFAWQGARLYLRVLQIETEGPLFAEMVAGVTRQAGRAAGRRIRAAVLFRIEQVRPLIDLEF